MWFESSTWSARIALIDQHQSLTYKQLAEAVAARRDWLASLQVERVALCMDNQVEWVLFDLACQSLSICCIPVPAFFSVEQRQHTLASSAVEVLLMDQSLAPEDYVNTRPTPFNGISAQTHYPKRTPQIPHGTHKITFTSGTTGTPKGVCLSNDNQLTVARSLADAVALDAPKHLCLLPLATLLENIAGIYAPLLRGGCVYLASASERGFSGSRLVDPSALLQLIQVQQPSTLILVPELLSVLVAACAKGWQAPTSLTFIAVGGGKVSAQLLSAAHEFGLPVYQGYGLSECASVVALNTPKATHLECVGKVLPHNQLRVENQQLIISGNVFLGYLNQPESFYPTSFATGDLASLEGDWLSITGRQKNIIINSFGRNLSPEWIEAELLATQLFRHVLVFGDALPSCGVILVPHQPTLATDTIEHVLTKLNQHLPDYAQLHHYLVAKTPFEQLPGAITQTGKLIRNNILAHYQSAIESLYQPAICQQA
ncbi:AMP-binding protein [Marinomonas ostreistagni]|uniref:AMP-binding protein n=1 Tax=Marinomonas ostreistagni TaxID=359209 RepID=UPI001951FB40|nr:AMP-binding protein [Marinomonas ostreistagni]MBM6549518.1 AMP-binding protein [Marinomonas ostreistagni]